MLRKVGIGLSVLAAVAAGTPVAAATPSANAQLRWVLDASAHPDVLTLNYLARSTAGRTFVTSLMVSDPAAALSEDSVVRREPARCNC